MTKKYLSLERLTEYDSLIKTEIAEGDESAKKYTDDAIANKIEANHEFITVEDIDIICGGSVQYAEDVMF